MRTRSTASRSTSSAESPSDIGFGAFRLDVRAGLLLRAGERIPLRAKTWSVLRYLADRPGVLITKDELLDALWPDVAVTPDTLSKSIGELRVALGDESQAPRFIETVHRRGFRFIADVHAEAGGGAPVATPAIAANGPPPTFVGRDQELALLNAALARAAGGERQLVFVTAPAGAGKSALIEAFTAGAAARDPAGPLWITYASCFEHYGPLEPYLPLLDAVEQLARLPDARPFIELMHHLAPMWLLQLPGLLSDDNAEQVRRSLAGIGIERMARELALLFEALTAELTVVLVLEDLQWSDPSTIDLLILLARRRNPARLLVIGTYRPAELAVRGHPLAGAVRALRGQRQCSELPLADLREADVRAYLAARFPDNRFPPALAGLLHTHTGGHPLFMVGIVDHIRSRGWILDTEPGWSLTAPLASLDLGVPDDVRRMIETQLHGLDPAERALLEAASIASPQIAPPIVAAILGCETDAAETLCEALAAAGRFLVVAGTIEWPNGDVARRYAFTHDLRLRVVADEIPPDRLKRLHRRAGEALEAAYGSRAGEIAAQLAVHFQRGRVPAKALRCMIASGTRARGLGASREALALLEPGLALLELLDANEDHRRLELDLHLTLGRSLGDIHGFAAESVRHCYERASQLCMALGAEAEFCEVLSARWYLHALRAERDETLALAAQIDALAERLGGPDLRVLADAVLLRTAVYDARFAAARAHMRSLAAHSARMRESAPRSGYGTDPVTAGIVHDAMAQWFLGDSAGALATADDAIGRARAQSDPFTLCATLSNAALVNLWARRDADAEALAAHALTLAAEHGFLAWNIVAGSVAGLAAVRAGRIDVGIQTMDVVLATMQSSRTRFFSTFVHAFMAEACLRNGAFEEGVRHAEIGIELSRTTLDRPFQPELWRLKGELLRAAAAATTAPRRSGKRRAATQPVRPIDDVERCFGEALELARATQARALELRATISLARAWHDGGRRADARALLADICAQFDPASVDIDVREARTLFAALSTAS